MRRFLPLPGLAATLAAASLHADTVARIDAGRCAVAFDDHGSLVELRRAGSPRNLVAQGQPAPVLQLRIAGQWHAANTAAWNAAASRLDLGFAGTDADASLVVRAKSTHVVLTLDALRSKDAVEIVRWGPYPSSIGETIGEIVGVARDRDDAVGIQALDVKTLGGSPQNENDIDAEFGADDPGRYPGMPAELSKGQHFRADTARPMPFGSVLQAYVRVRDHERVLPNWGHERYRVPAFDDGGARGSHVALFACAAPDALATIGAIEVAEGLPHPMIGGEWAKVARGASASYLIVDFGEANIARAVEMTRRAGLRHLYHSSPFATWGHFQLKTNLFPNGWAGFRACADQARAAGVELGFHTLSNFITPNDPYASPDADPRLAAVGGAPLSADVDAAAAEIPVDEPSPYARKSALNTVRIGKELVQYDGVAAAAPWRLLGCRRGAWGTRAASHARGTEAARLLDHDYKTFLGDAALSAEIARTIARFCNETGARQLSFDGLEGNWSTGMGQYGRALFTKAWYDALDPSLRGGVINDASNPGHFNWHANTRMNWGEPWYAGFRESQTLYRFKNQLLFERNLMPRMLGWFALRPGTSVEDAEWLLARAAGFDAGFALATSLASTAQLEADPASADTARRFGATAAILAAMREWETARRAGAFTAEAKARLRDNAREFHLAPAGPGKWDLLEAHVARADSPTNAPAATLAFDNPDAPQPLRWVVRSDAKSPVAGLVVSLGDTRVLALGDRAIPPGGSVRYAGGADAVIADDAWKEIARVPVDPAACTVPRGASRLVAAATLPAGARLCVEARTYGEPARLAAP